MGAAGAVRSDLLALTDEGLMQLSNAGQVKRALRDLAAGRGPVLTEDEDGWIEARYEDGTVTRLAPSAPLPEATCTCSSSGFCRHRVLLALSYRERRSQEKDAPDTGAETGWSPAEFDLDAIEAALSPAVRAQLKGVLRGGLSVKLEQGAQPAAHLPMASVRFLVPGDLDYVRCDCAAGNGCLHVPLAVRAFRQAKGAAETWIGGEGRETAMPAGRAVELGEAADAAIAHLLAVGAVAGAEAHRGAVQRVRRAAEAVGAVQLRLVADALDDAFAAYDARSARYDELALLSLAAELYARPRARDAGGALGLGQVYETGMSKTRLVSLGARLTRIGGDILARCMLADSDTGATMVAERQFSPSEAGGEDFAEKIRRRRFAPGLVVGALSCGQVLTSVAKRRADGLIGFGGGAGGRSQVMPRNASQSFRQPLLAEDGGALLGMLESRAPGFLRPRSRIDAFHIFPVAEIMGQAWDAARQLWRAAVTLPDRTILHLERAYDSAAPHAIDALSSALAGRDGALRFVSGPVRAESGALVCEPWSLNADRFVLPDLEDRSAPPPETDAVLISPADLPERTARALAGALHAGESRSAPESTSRELRAGGFVEMARRFDGWRAAPAAPDAFGEAAIWLLTLWPGLGGGSGSRGA